MRQQLSWLVRGRVHTVAALAEHAQAISELQARVDALAQAVDEMVQRVPAELRGVVDDLSARIDAVAEQNGAHS